MEVIHIDINIKYCLFLDIPNSAKMKRCAWKLYQTVTWYFDVHSSLSFIFISLFVSLN